MMARHPAPDAIVAVLTGDLIGSTRIERARVEQTMDLLGDESRRAGQPWLWPIWGARFTRFRGDGWQMLLARPHLALRHALFLMACLRARKDALPTRIAIGIGRIESAGSDELNDAAGAAFVASGRGLDLMRTQERLALTGAPADPPLVTAAEQAAVALLDERLSRWTPEQAEAAALHLHPGEPILKDLATRLGITPQAVGYRVRGAGAPAIRKALSLLEPEWARRWHP